jgi:hypothetical protein
MYPRCTAEVAVIFLLLRLVWFVGVLGLIFLAVADLLFGTLPMTTRLNNLLPRIAVAFVWPLALFTPRGRYLLWARWQHGREE